MLPLISKNKRQPEEGNDTSALPFMAHLVELRWRMKAILLAFFAFAGLSFFFSRTLFWLLVLPYTWAVETPEQARLIYTAPQEYFFVQLKLACFSGFILTFPFFAFHIYRFMAPGLYKRERKILFPFLVIGPALFTIGAMLVYFVVMPTCLRFFWLMSRQQTHVHVELLPRVSEYLSLMMSFILAFGLCFQLPLILFLLHMFDFITLKTLRENRRYAIVLSFIVAAVLTPPDILSQIMLGVPLVLIYEFAIIAIALRQKGYF